MIRALNSAATSLRVGPLSEFLTEVALGWFDASGFPDVYRWHGQERIDIPSRPVFGPDDEGGLEAGVVSPPMPPIPDPDFWRRRVVLWGEYGPGMLGEVRIFAPGAPGEWDLVTLLEQRYAQVQTVERDSRGDVPCYPEISGAVSWGVLSDGRTLAWALVVPDPDAWPVAVIYAQ